MLLYKKDIKEIRKNFSTKLGLKLKYVGFYTGEQGNVRLHFWSKCQAKEFVYLFDDEIKKKEEYFNNKTQEFSSLCKFVLEPFEYSHAIKYPTGMIYTFYNANDERARMNDTGEIVLDKVKIC